MNLEVNVSIGEFIDKITILKIKINKIKDKEKLKNLKFEKNLLDSKLKKLDIKNKKKFNDLMIQLLEINNSLWEIEDQIRVFEKNNKFNEDFVNLARSVYKTNDKRFEVKDEINRLFNSSIKEVKSYEKY